MSYENSEPVEIGHGFTVSEYREDGELRGYSVIGPAGPNCKSPHGGRCGGLVPTKPYGARAVWEIVNTKPLTLTPSIVCDCGDQHGFIRNGKYVPA